jgi:hypothetical protein
MNGVLEFANPRLARYAVRINRSDYTVFELLGSAELAVGEAVCGDLRAQGGETYLTSQHGEIYVHAKGHHYSRAAAAHWVTGSRVAARATAGIRRDHRSA